MRSSVVMAAGLLLAGCFNPSYDQARCGPDGACPSGLACVAEFCVSSDLPIPPAAKPGDVVWARSMSMATPVGITQAAGVLRVSGYYNAPTDLGTGLLTPRSVDTAILQLSPDDASTTTAHRFGGAGEEFGWVSSVSGDQSLVYGVSYGGEVDLGQGPVAGGGGPGADGFVGWYRAGAPSSVQRLIGPGEDKIVDATGAPDDTYAIGWYEGLTSIANSSFDSLGGSRDILIARFPSNASPRIRTFGSTARDESTGIALGVDWVVAAGFFAGTLDFGNGTSPLSSVDGALDVWVAKLSSNLDPQWTVRLGGNGEDRSGRIVLDAESNFYVIGFFTGEATFGNITLTSRGASDVFLAKLSGADGTVLWARSFGSEGADSHSSLTLDTAGNALITAQVAGPIEPGGPHAGGLDAVLASYAPDGTRRWLKLLGTAGDDRGWGVAGANEAGYFGVSVSAPLADPGAPLVGAANYTGLVLKIIP